jgi:hypothetical protein
MKLNTDGCFDTGHRSAAPPGVGRSYGWTRRIAAFSAAATLHSLLILLLLLQRPHTGVLSRPTQDGHSSVTEPALTLVLLAPDCDAVCMRHRSQPPVTLRENLAAPRIALADVEIPDVLLLSRPRDLLNERPTAAQSDAHGSVVFHCEVHFHQNPQGQVQAIDFGTCTGDAAWQHSLIETLQRAAQLVSAREGASFPPVRTLVFDTDALSPDLLAEQLAEPPIGKRHFGDGPR